MPNHQECDGLEGHIRSMQHVESSVKLLEEDLVRSFFVVGIKVARF
jgi:hypothetical protein